MKKVTTGANDRPSDSTIAQSGSGLPDDSGKPIEVADKQVELITSKLQGDRSEKVKKEIDEDADLAQRGSP